jgi:hypothetical protein
VNLPNASNGNRGEEDDAYEERDRYISLFVILHRLS